MDFSQVLLNAQSPDSRIRNEAAQHLASRKSQNLGMYLTALTAELVDENKDFLARTAAGIILKNALSSPKNEITRQQQEKDWIELDPAIRENIKNGILHSLGSPVVFSTAAQVCSCVAQIELPKNLWPHLISILLQNAQSDNVNLKRGTLQAIGYICEELNPTVVAGKTNEILTAIVKNMLEEETNFDVKYAATKALESALEFANENFKIEAERDFILKVVCAATCSPSEQLKVAGYECLVKIASLYYVYLPTYMQTLFGLTLESIKKDPQPVALQAIEFWSTICDEEICLLQEIEEANTFSIQPTTTCHFFVKGAMQFLVPIILETLTKQDEDAFEDQWDVSMAGATCLTLIANCVRNEIVEPVVGFVTKNLNSPEWRMREAAAMAFGSILEGVYDMQPTIVQVLPFLVTQMQSDTSPLVKDTAAWTIGRICQLHPFAIRGNIINSIMNPLLTALNDTPRVAANVCWALNNIAETFRDEEARPAENFKPYFEASVIGLLNASERPDADESNLKAAAYEAINEFVQSAENEECKQVVKDLVPVFQARLENTFKIQVISQEDREQVSETQGLLASLLQTCTQKLDKEIKPNADVCAELYLKVLNTKSTTVQEEALMAFGALANALEADFAKYMPHFHPFLLLGLQTYDSYQVCSIAVGVVGDICSALQKLVTPYCFEIISILISLLQNSSLHKSVKPPILSCFGDIALAICGEFSKYLIPVMNILFQAASYQVDKTNEEMVDYQNELREGIFEAFAGILQGLRTDDQADAFLPFAEHVVAFITGVIFIDPTRSEAVTRGAIGALGDLAHSLTHKVKPLLEQDAVRNIIAQSLSDCEPYTPTYEVARWTQEVIANS
eukprot:Phypoly_transcript_02146.p1 GENE.Phypoly_transcript_02146~~Phypoly_transcript_02146.p1  ORF type:complete len:854 (+),score=127.98 Phypoly_transcript_02146:100-2661(+)